MPKIPYTDIIPYFGDPESSGDFFVYFVESLSANSIRVWFSNEVVVNNAYYNVLNYVITTSIGPLPVVEVIKTNENVLPFATLHVKPQTAGSNYTITVNNIKDVIGASLLTNTASWTYERTKVDSLLGSIPKVYDKRPTSVLHRILDAIGYADGQIGGSDLGLDEE